MPQNQTIGMSINVKINGKDLSLKNFAGKTGKSVKHVRRMKQLFWAMMAEYLSHRIETLDLEENAPLTAFIKGHNTPLKDTGDLQRAIEVKQINQHAVRVGISQSHPKYKIYKAIHNGTIIKVSEKMRSMFEILAAVSAGVMSPSKLTGGAERLYKRKPGGWKSLNQDTKAIVIPARKFMNEILDDETRLYFQKKLSEEFDKFMKRMY